jgi:hypothetical protein
MKLGELMDACEECADADIRSYDEHFAECPICKEYAQAAEKLNIQAEFLEDLASKPLEERKQILGARMREFLDMPEAERKAAISDLLGGLTEIPREDMMKVVKARTDVMMEIPMEQRETLMMVLGSIMKEWSKERKMIERKAVMKATEDYFFLKRKMVRKKFAELVE